MTEGAALGKPAGSGALTIKALFLRSANANKQLSWPDRARQIVWAYFIVVISGGSCRESFIGDLVMHQPKLWWAGLIPVAMLWAAGTASKQESIEKDLVGKVRNAVGALPADAVDGAVVSGAGRDIRLTGAGFSAQSALQAAASADNAYGVRLVEADLKAFAVAKPYQFSARRNANQFTIEGHMPLPSVRGNVLTAAKTAAPGATIVDGLKYAAGAPAGYEAQAAYALSQASRLSDGAASFIDGAYTISGTAATSPIYDASMAATLLLPPGLTLAKVDILAPETKPYAWGATRNATGLTLTGFAPSDAARIAIAARAAAIFPNVQIANRMQVARGAPAGDFAATAAYGLAELGKLASGSVGLSDSNYSISGAASNAAGYDAAVAATRQLPQGLTLAKADILPIEMKPYVWGATHEGASVTLTGFAPNDVARSAIAARASAVFPNAQIANRMQIASGAPAGDFAAAASYGLAELGKLSGGSVSFADASYSIAGGRSEQRCI